MLLRWENYMLHSNILTALATGCLLVACSSSDTKSVGSGGSGAAAGSAGAVPNAGGALGASGNAGSSGSAVGGAAGSAAGAGGSAGGGAGGGAGSLGGGAGSGGAAGSGAIGTCTPPLDVFSPIVKLSQTGCTDPTDTRKPIARAVAYELNSPLWSDSADKQRAFVLPAGAKIHIRNCTASAPNLTDCPNGIQDDGRWDFPVGTVMIKIFMFDQKLVETRLFMHLNATNWVGYSYEWDEAQTDATIVSADRVSVMFNTGTRPQPVPWHYPSQDDCLTCHNQAAGSTLGPETAQMNRVVGGMNQLDQFAQLGLFDAPVVKPYKTPLVTPYPGQLGGPSAGATTAQQARSYLHANCGFCHRPGGAFALFDLRYDTLLKDTHICNVDINKAAPSGAAATKIMVSGDANDSAMWQRMNLTDPDTGRMPQIGSYAVDTSGVNVVGAWINALTAADCTSATQ
jgi:uncharacterized repeat protein (TIGR03806 family)